MIGICSALKGHLGVDKQSTSFSIGNCVVNDDFVFVFVIDSECNIKKGEIYSNISESMKKYLNERRNKIVLITP